MSCVVCQCRGRSHTHAVSEDVRSSRMTDYGTIYSYFVLRPPSSSPVLIPRPRPRPRPPPTGMAGDDEEHRRRYARNGGLADCRPSPGLLMLMLILMLMLMRTRARTARTSGLSKCKGAVRQRSQSLKGTPCRVEEESGSSGSSSRQS